LCPLRSSGVQHPTAPDGQNAAARLVFNIRRSDHVTDALIYLHWLRVAERIRFKMAVMAYRSIHGLPPYYLHGFLPYQAGSLGFRSASSQRLIVPRTRLSSVGDRSFPVAGAEVWNDLPSHVISAPSLSIFRNRLRTYLYYNVPCCVPVCRCRSYLS
jgi:hypothetical protein